MAETSLLSARAVETLGREVNWRDLQKTLAIPFHRDTQPDGLINMGLAESSLMHEELVAHMRQNFDVDPTAHLTYGQGPKGSPLLRSVLSKFLNRRFEPINPIHEEQLVITSGVASAIDSLTWCICNEDEGVLSTQPLYAGFISDVELKSRGKLLPVSYLWDSREYNPMDLFDPLVTRAALQRALQQYADKGIKSRAVLISNPHNPLGRCYSEETLIEIARFCHQNSLHFISDEIYANSTFKNTSFPDAQPFKSVLSIDLTGIIDLNHVHMMYGMSKDFCANGMRLGAVQTKNDSLNDVLASINQFAWPAYLTQEIWGRILMDDVFVDNFISLNQQRLTERYDKLTSLLRQHNIPYLKGGNSGFFIWAQLIRPTTGVSPPSMKSMIELKAELVLKCVENGLFIRDGQKYFAEEPQDGWFRITFTVDDHVLSVGWERLLKSLRATGHL